MVQGAVFRDGSQRVMKVDKFLPGEQISFEKSLLNRPKNDISMSIFKKEERSTIIKDVTSYVFDRVTDLNQSEQS